MRSSNEPVTVEWRDKTIRLYVDPRVEEAERLLDAAAAAIERATDAGQLYDRMVDVANDYGVDLAGFVDGPDHFHPFDDWITIGFRPSWRRPSEDRVPSVDSVTAEL